ncbi:MAG: aldolase/citrate lyase family protein [Candidatus Poribacteria bacterium]|nr:aldolase/citrate lyase family protein [Candidatus Poribacteria bacterium]
MSELTLKQRIHNGEAVNVGGAPMDSTKEQLEDIFSKDSYDLVGIDSQHSAFVEKELVRFCGMAEDLGVPAMFRIKHTRHAFLIGNYVDLGPLAIVVPQVENESTVDEAIDAFYYPQVGKRSWGPSSGYGIKAIPDRLEYAEWWNNNGILCLQIESVNAVINARKLAKPGVDMLVFGANDLSFSLESYTNPPFKTVDDCIRHVVEQMEGTGVKVGVGTSPSGKF